MSDPSNLLQTQLYETAVVGHASAQGTVIVTGAAGYLGRRLVSTLLENTSAAVIGIDKAGPDHVAGRLRLIRCDLSTAEGVEGVRRLGDLLQDATIFHLAGLFVKDVSLYPYVSPSDYERDNVEATRRLVDVVLESRCQPRLVVFSSTACVYDGVKAYPTPVESVYPLFPYAESKLEAERQIARLASSVPQVAILRFSRVIGMGEGSGLPHDIVSDFVERIVQADAAGVSCSITSTSEVRPYLYIDDLMAVLLQLYQRYHGTGLIIRNVTSPTPIRIGEVAAIVGQTMERQGLLRARPSIRMWSAGTRTTVVNPLPYPGFYPQQGSSALVTQWAAWQYCEAIKRTLEAEPDLGLLSAVRRMRPGVVPLD